MDDAELWDIMLELERSNRVIEHINREMRFINQEITDTFTNDPVQINNYRHFMQTLKRNLEDELRITNEIVLKRARARGS